MHLFLLKNKTDNFGQLAPAIYLSLHHTFLHEAKDDEYLLKETQVFPKIFPVFYMEWILFYQKNSLKTCASFIFFPIRFKKTPTFFNRYKRTIYFSFFI